MEDILKDPDFAHMSDSDLDDRLPLFEDEKSEDDESDDDGDGEKERAREEAEARYSLLWLWCSRFASVYRATL